MTRGPRSAAPGPVPVSSGVIGLFVGLLAFDGRNAAVLAATLGGVIGDLLYGTSIGSFSGLESPDPSYEPSDSATPLAEPAVEEEGDNRDASASDR